MPPSSSQQANSTNQSTTTNVGGNGVIIGGNARDIGLTGAQFTALGQALLASGVAYNHNAVEMETNIQTNLSASYDRSVASITNNLNSLIDASRDFSQRAISASSGQQTPIVNLPAAGSSPAIVDAATDSGNNWFSPIVIVGVVTIVIMLAKK